MKAFDFITTASVKSPTDSVTLESIEKVIAKVEELRKKYPAEWILIAPNGSMYKGLASQLIALLIKENLNVPFTVTEMEHRNEHKN